MGSCNCINSVFGFQLTEIQEYILEWKDKLKVFVMNLTKMESNMKTTVSNQSDPYVRIM